MSQENVEVVRQATDAYNRGAFTEAIAWMDPEIEWDMSRVEVPDPDTYRGLERLQAFHESWRESWGSLELEIEELIDAGDEVISVVRQHGRGRLSGAEVEQGFAQVWALRDGKIIRMTMYPDRESALEAAG